MSTVNSLYTPNEIAYQLQDCRAKYIISVDPMIAAAREAASEANLKPENVLDLKSLFELIVKDDGSYLPHVFTTNNPDDHVVCLPYSSGTTGRPKGVMLTDTNLTSHAMIFGNEKFMSTREDIKQICIMGMVPFFHAYGLAVLLGVYVHLGSRIVCLPRFDPEMFLKLIQQEKVNMFNKITILPSPGKPENNIRGMDDTLSTNSIHISIVQCTSWESNPHQSALRCERQNRSGTLTKP